MESNKISIIIPVYNVKPYLERCLESVIKQTYGNLEIIIVDDGSNDGGELICDEYGMKYKNTKVIHQQNQGLSAARNAGLELATGNWIAFLDSDDWIHPQMYEILLAVALKTNTQISSCLSQDCYDGVIPDVSYRDTNKMRIFTESEMIKGLWSKKVMRFEVWNKLWKRELIGDVRYVPGQVSEDIHFDRILFLKAKKISHIDRVLHYYTCNRPGSTASSFKMGRMCIYDEFKLFIDDLTEKEEKEVIANIAVKFAINMYNEAFWEHVDKEVMSLLKKHFDYFKKQVHSNYLISKSKVFLFKINPTFYCYVSKLKKYLM